MGARRRFLEGLEHVVGRLLGEAVGTGDHGDAPASCVRGEREELLERRPGLLVTRLALRGRPHPIDAHVLGRPNPRARSRDAPSSPPGPVLGVEQLRGEGERRGRLADALGPDQQQRVRELVIDPARHQALENGAVADHRVQRGHGTDCAELPAVTQSQTPAQAAVPPHRAESGRHYAARVILYMEAAFLVLISFGFFSGAEGTDLLSVAGGGGLCIVGVVILGVGATRMRHDVPVVRDPADPDAKVPWDWTDFVMFWPGWFSAFQLLGSVAVIITNLIGNNSDPTVRNAIESSVLAVCQYGGMLFNISCSRSCAVVARCATSDGADSSGGGFPWRRSPHTSR